MTKTTLLLACLCGAMLLVYSNHFHNAFHFDDSHAIQDNAYIVSLKNIPKFFFDRTTSSSLPSHQGYRPIVTTTLAIDYAMGGKLEPFYFHVSNFVWFMIVTLCIYPLLLHLLQSIRHESVHAPLAVFGCAIFGVHTANAETVNYVIARSDILSGAFHMLAFVLYLAGGVWRRRHVYLLPAAFGIFTKESAIMLAPVFLVYLYLFEKQRSIPEIFTREGMKDVFRCLAKGFPMLFVCFGLTGLAASQGHYVPGGTSPRLYAMTQPYVLMLYVKTFFLPTHLSADTDVPLVSGWSDERVPIGLGFLTLLLALTIAASRRKEWRPLAFGIIWFVLTLLPTSSFIPLSEPLNDHRTFLAYIGLIIATVTCLANLLSLKQAQLHGNHKLRVVLISILILVLCGFAYGTRKRNEVWRSEESLWKDVTEKSPRNGRGWMNYGLTQMSQGKYAEADAAFREAMKTTPHYSTLHVNIGVLKSALGRRSEAEAAFQAAMRFGPHEVDPYFFYARFLVSADRFEEAELALRRGLQIYPGHLGCRQALMRLYERMGRADSLRRIAEETLAIYPSDRSSKEALNYARNPRAMMPEEREKSDIDYVNESLGYYNLGEYEKAIELSYKALQLNPRSAAAHNNICSASVLLKRYDAAIAACKKALEINPQMTLAANNLAWAIEEKEKHRK